jgi:hypothetical protein
MTKRRVLRWSLVLVILAAFAVWLEPTRVGWGWLRGEAFYQGRPTSYWRALIERDLQMEPRKLLAQVFPLPGAAQPAAWWDRFREWIGYRPHADSSAWLIAWAEEPTEVLRTLANDSDERISGFAADASKLRPWIAPQNYWLEVIQKHQRRVQ